MWTVEITKTAPIERYLPADLSARWLGDDGKMLTRGSVKLIRITSEATEIEVTTAREVGEGAKHLALARRKGAQPSKRPPAETLQAGWYLVTDRG